MTPNCMHASLSLPSLTQQRARARAVQCRRRLLLLGLTCPSLATTHTTVRSAAPVTLPHFALPHPSPRHSSLYRTRHLATVLSAAHVTSPHPAAGHQRAAPRQAAPHTRSCSTVKDQRPRWPLPSLVASAVKHSTTVGRTYPAAPPPPAYKRRR